MKVFVGVTDNAWFATLKEHGCTEANFWLPSARSFKALKPGDLFLFKLHYPQNRIVGGGFFVSYSVLPTFLAWDAFGVGNGTGSLQELDSAIRKYRKKRNQEGDYLQIGCVVLDGLFYFDEANPMPAPPDWSSNIVMGKTYSADGGVGSQLVEQVASRVSGAWVVDVFEEDALKLTRDEVVSGYRRGMVNQRIGQGSFRVLITDAYQRRCAITGERTLPVLQAAHIKSFSEGGPNAISNGILLRSDLHTLYDRGYLAIDEDYRVDVSKRLHEDFDNGQAYYALKGCRLAVLPERQQQRPLKEYLQWHNDMVYLG